MSNPIINVPVVPLQPNQAAYGIASLYITTQYDRSTYAAAFGVDPPDQDTTRPPQSWFLTNPDGTPLPPTNFLVFDPTQGKLVSLLVQQPSAPNIAGVHSYPPYVIPPTSAVIVAAGATSGSGVNPNSLSLESDVQALVSVFKQWDPSCGYTQGFSGGPYTIQYPSNEPRRYWLITFKGLGLLAQALVMEQNQEGIGAPGQWIYVTGSAEPTWVTSVPSSVPPLVGTPLAVPCRGLLPNEILQRGLMDWQIVRTDLQPSTGGSAAPGDGFTAADRTTLNQIQSIVSRAFGT